MLGNHFAQDPEATGIMEHPEDLGAVSSGHHPGSAWQFTNVKELLKINQVKWGALAQSQFGTPCPKPTRLLGRLMGIEKLFCEGPPTIDAK
jgi:hypothetical protein